MQHGAFAGSTDTAASQVEMLSGLQSLLSLKLRLVQDMSRDAGYAAGQISTMSTGLRTANHFGMSETNVMTL